MSTQGYDGAGNSEEYYHYEFYSFVQSHGLAAYWQRERDRHERQKAVWQKEEADRVAFQSKIDAANAAYPRLLELENKAWLGNILSSEKVELAALSAEIEKLQRKG